MQGDSDLDPLWRNFPFLIYMTGTTISITGTWMQRILVGWLTWEMTGSGTWLGLIAAADLLPTVITAPFAGAVVDRWKRITIAKATESLRVLQALSLAILFAINLLNIELLFILTVVNGTLTAINQPARHALIYSLVGKENISRAIAIHSVAFNIARMIGPMIAGTMIISFGIGWGFFLIALSFVAFVTALILLNVETEPRAKSQRSFLAESRDGIVYTFKHQGIAGVLLLMLALGLGVRPISDLLPGYVDRVFDSDASGLVALTSALALGAILGSVLFTGFYEIKRVPKAVILNGIGVALTTIAFTFIPSLFWGLPVFVLVGFYLARSGIASQVYIQLAAPEEMRGRILSFHGMIQRAGPAIGALIIGTATDFMGFRWPVILGCALLLFCSAFVVSRKMLSELKEDAL